MDPEELHEHIHTLSENLTTLETALQPLLTNPLPTISAPLTALSKAKLSALSAYAIESLLFSSIRLNGTVTDARTHPVFAELARTKGCFERIARAEDPNRGKATMRVDRDAARRIVKAGLAGNEALQRQQVHQSLQQAHNQQLERNGLKRKAEEVMDDEDDESESEIEQDENAHQDHEAKHTIKDGPQQVDKDSTNSSSLAAETTQRTAKQRSDDRKARKKEKRAQRILASSLGKSTDTPQPSKQEKAEAKKAKRAARIQQKEQSHQKSKKTKPNRPPKAPTEVFQALVSKAEQSKQ